MSDEGSTKIRVACPSCGKRYLVRGAKVGLKRACKSCGATIELTNTPTIPTHSTGPVTEQEEAESPGTLKALGAVVLTLALCAIPAYAILRYNGVDLLSFLDRGSARDAQLARAPQEEDKPRTTPIPDSEQNLLDLGEEPSLPGKLQKRVVDTRPGSDPKAESKQQGELNEQARLADEKRQRDEELVRSALALTQPRASDVNLLTDALKLTSLTQQERDEIQVSHQLAIEEEMLERLRPLKNGDALELNRIARQYAVKYPSYPRVFLWAAIAADMADDPDLTLEMSDRFLETMKLSKNPRVTPPDDELAKLWFARGMGYLRKENAPEALSCLKTAVVYGKDHQGFKDALEFVEKELKLLGPPLKVGDYVQNPGFLQLWIGRIIEIQGNTYRVRVTYANPGVVQRNPFKDKEGKTVDLLAGEFKRLETVSLDAMLKGYR